MTIIKSALLLLVLGLIACGKNSPVPQIPNVIVNKQINLNNIEYNKLRQVNGYVYIEGGVRGIIIIRQNTNRYLAIERNCTYQPGDECARVEADQSGLFLVDPCCHSQFDLSGQVTGGPAAYPLRQYATALNGNFLYITN